MTAAIAPDAESLSPGSGWRSEGPAVPAYAQVKMKDAPRLLELARDGGLHYLDKASLVIVVQLDGTRSVTQWFPWKAICTATSGDAHWKNVRP